MSFTKTISTVAALASIFSVGFASWKISEDIKNSQTAPLDQRIEQLEKQLEETKNKQSVVTEAPQPMPLPTTTSILTQTPQPTILPPVAPPPPPVTNDSH